MTITINSKEAGDNARDFMAILDDTLDILDAIERERVGESGQSKGWQILEVSKQNPIRLVIASLAGLPVFGSFVGGIQDLESGPSNPFPRHAMHHVERLGSRLEQNISVTFETDGASVTPSRILKEHAKAALGDRHYAAHSSVDGTLDLIEVTKRLHFVLYDDNDGHRVNCKFPVHLLDRVKSMLGTRVTVTGLVFHRTLDDQPTKIEADDIRLLGDSEREGVRFAELPPIKIRSSEASEDYIRRFRDAE